VSYSVNASWPLPTHLAKQPQPTRYKFASTKPIHENLTKALHERYYSGFMRIGFETFEQ
jgi:hypothetical protein